MQEQGIVSVTFLDDFVIAYKGVILDESRINSDKITQLLSYILSHRHNKLSVGELAEALWEDEESDNPVNALKNLVYRTRNILRQYFGKIEFIKSGRGYYCWNKDIHVCVDAEEFEDMYEKAESEQSCIKKVEYQKKALAYYKKHFLEHYTDYYWVVTLNAYYHTMYINEVVKISRNLYKLNDYKTMERVCNQALMTDELSEEIHYYYMRALIGQDKVNAAKKHFVKLKQLFNEKLCVEPSKKLSILIDDVAVNNSVLHKPSRGAHVCNYEMFKENCEIERRRMARTRENAYTVMFTSVADIEGIFLNTLTHSLRESDIVSVYDNSHYFILLPDCSIDNAEDIIERILDNCTKKKLENIPEYELKKLTYDEEK